MTARRQRGETSHEIEGVTAKAVKDAGDSESVYVETRYGIAIDTRQPVWYVDGGKHGINVAAVRDAIGRELSVGIEAVLRFYARTKAPGTLGALVASLLHYCRVTCGSSVLTKWGLQDIRKYRERLLKEFGHEQYLIKLRPALTHWHSQGHPGLGREVVDALRKMKLRQPEAGRAVRRMDPTSGPMTEQEQADLDADVFAGAESGLVSLEDFAQYLLQNARTGTGRRPEQLARLKCSDVDPQRRAVANDVVAPPGEGYHLVRVPRIKRRGGGWRETFRDIPMSHSLFGIVHAQRLSVEFRFEELLSAVALTDLDPLMLKEIKDDLPLFPDWKSVEAGIKQASESGVIILRKHSEGRAWHLSGDDVTSRLKAIVKTVETVSRTGEPLPMTSMRMRHTKGTNLVRSGVSNTLAAWLMDHSTTHTIAMYVDNLPDHAAAISERLKGSVRMQLVARMFRGELVDAEAYAKRGDDPRVSRIYWKGQGAASCGIDKRCGMDGGIPLACYTCNNFQPWVDGPHEAVLQTLIRERERDELILGKDNPIAKRRDQTIAAVSEVVQRCAVRRAELEVGR